MTIFVGQTKYINMKLLPFKTFFRDCYLEHNISNKFNVVDRDNIDIGLIVNTERGCFSIVENTGIDLSNPSNIERIYDLVEEYKNDNGFN